MSKKELIYDKIFNISIETKMYDEIKKRAHEQKRSLSQIARLMFEKCIEKENDIELENDIEKNMYEDIKEIKAIQIEFQDFMKDYMEDKSKYIKELKEDK